MTTPSSKASREVVSPGAQSRNSPLVVAQHARAHTFKSAPRGSGPTPGRRARLVRISPTWPSPFLLLASFDDDCSVDESNPIRILRARSIVSEPHQDVFLQGKHAFRQRLGSAHRWKAVNEGFSGLDSELVQWRNRRTAIVSSAAVSKPKSFESGIVINGRFLSNYYHWVNNILPKVFLVEKQGTVPKAVPVLVSSSVKGTPAEDALQLVLGRRREILFIPDEPHHVLDAYMVETAVHEIAHLSGRKPFDWDSLGGFNFSFMRFYRQFFLHAQEKAFSGESASPPPRIHLSRPSRVRPFNENDGRTVLGKYFR